MFDTLNSDHVRGICNLNFRVFGSRFVLFDWHHYTPFSSIIYIL